jgi:hypothetical protein
MNNDNYNYITPSMHLTSRLLQERTHILKSSDWTQSPDSPLSAEEKSQWAAYRQAWRDITSQNGFPDNVVIPMPPNLVDPRQS